MTLLPTGWHEGQPRHLTISGKVSFCCWVAWSLLTFTGDRGSLRAEVCSIQRHYHVGLDSLAIPGSSLIDVLASLIRSHKADCSDIRMVTNEIHSFKQEIIRYNCGAQMLPSIPIPTVLNLCIFLIELLASVSYIWVPPPPVYASLQ